MCSRRERDKFSKKIFAAFGGVLKTAHFWVLLLRWTKVPPRSVPRPFLRTSIDFKDKTFFQEQLKISIHIYSKKQRSLLNSAKLSTYINLKDTTFFQFGAGKELHKSPAQTPKSVDHTKAPACEGAVKNLWFLTEGEKKTVKHWLWILAVWEGKSNHTSLTKNTCSPVNDCRRF